MIKIQPIYYSLVGCETYLSSQSLISRQWWATII
nr:MAG TPA: hypothetical protein [Bacteriophage sp.]